MTRVLIAADRSDEAADVARAAHRLFGDEATYIVINVVEASPLMWGSEPMMWGMVYPLSIPPAYVAGDPTITVGSAVGEIEQSEPAPIEAAEQRASEVADEAELSGAEAIGETGRDPANAILAAAIDHQADVIVVGSHDRGWFSRLLAPSVSASVARGSGIPVLVVP